MKAIPLAEEVPTMDLWPDVGRDVLGLSKDATYAGAHRGEIPSIRVGRRFLVPTARLRTMLGLDNEPQRAE